MITFRDDLERSIERWRQDKIPIRSAVKPKVLTAFEDRHGITLPEDMREYFSTVDGTGQHYDEDGFFRFWPLKDMQTIDHYRPELANRYPGSSEYYLFLDHSIDLFMLAIRLQKNPIAPNPIARLFPQVDGSFEPAFASFTEVIRKYADNPRTLW